LITPQFFVSDLGNKDFPAPRQNPFHAQNRIDPVDKHFRENCFSRYRPDNPHSLCFAMPVRQTLRAPEVGYSTLRGPESVRGACGGVGSITREAAWHTRLV